MAPEAKDEELVLGETLTVTKSEVKGMDDGEFEHALAYARQKGTPEGDDEAKTLLSWRGKKAESDNSPEE